MRPRPDDYPEEEQEELEEPSQRSMFAQWGYRVLLAGVVLAVVVVLALPYLLDWWNPPPPLPAPIKSQIPPPPPLTPLAQKAEAPKPQPVLPPAKPVPAPVAAPPTTAKAPKVAAPAPEKAPATVETPAKKRALAKASTKGEYWVQVGAFADQANAARLVTRLTAQNYPVQQMERGSPERQTGGTHEVFVVGASPNEVNQKLPGKEYQAEAVGAEVIIRPTLGLKDAVTLSKDLARQGLRVKIRRSSPPASAAFYVVRVGGYPDRQQARAAQKELERKGFAGFIVKGQDR